MKKSQVLAALALAFALGVVAPVAGVVNSADTYAVEYDPARQASYCDVMNAVAAVRGLDAYKRFEKLYVAVYGYNNTDDKVFFNTRSTIDGNLVKTEVLNTYTEKQMIRSLTNAITTATGTTPVSTSLEGLMREAENIAFGNIEKGDFAAYANLFDYMTTKNADLAGKEGDFRGAITGVSTFLGNANWSPAQLKSYVLGNLAANPNAPSVKWARFDEYKKIAPVIAAYRNAQTYSTAVDSFANALKGLVGFDNVVLTSRDIETAEGDATNPLEAFYDLAKNDAKVNGFGYFNFYDADQASTANPAAPAGYAKLIYLANYAASHAQLKDGGINDHNKNLIDRIGNAYEGAVALVPGGIAEFKSLMAAYNGTCGSTSNDGSNNNGNTGDNQNKPTEGDNKAPNTGALTNTEGSASTTVAMVAGIATALTAAGAGVVAYRNARRSTRK